MMSQASQTGKKLDVKSLYQALGSELDKAREAKTYKVEVPIESGQGGLVQAAGRSQVMLASNTILVWPIIPALKRRPVKDWKSTALAWPQCVFSVVRKRFIWNWKSASLVSSAPRRPFCILLVLLLTKLFAALVGSDLGYPGTDYRDVIYSDQLNHASIIDGIRLARIAVKTTDVRAYKHNDLTQMKAWLEEDKAKDYRMSIIATDGVFSMEGEFADLADFVKTSRANDALLFVDESHATGVLGETGRGTPELCGVHGKIDVISGTLGKALGGANGGFIAGKKVLVDYMRQKSRPYTFSNTLPPAVV